jgi:hypothetical protein
LPFKVGEVTPRNTRKEKHEENVDDLEPEVPRIGLITCPGSVKTLTHRKDASEKTQKEFLSRSVTLLGFWGDFMGFFPAFNIHHDGAKWQDFDSLEDGDSTEHVPHLPRRHVRMVIDHLQRHTLRRGPKQTQQEHFAQMGMTLSPHTSKRHNSL